MHRNIVMNICWLSCIFVVVVVFAVGHVYVWLLVADIWCFAEADVFFFCIDTNCSYCGTAIVNHRGGFVCGTTILASVVCIFLA